jgi:hypothetical protein
MIVFPFKNEFAMYGYGLSKKIIHNIAEIYLGIEAKPEIFVIDCNVFNDIIMLDCRPFLIISTNTE